MKYIKEAVVSVLLTAFAVFIPANAFSMDTVYVNNPEIWYSDSEIVHMPEQNLEKYNGIYSYYTDTENSCFYLHISYDEENMKDGENDIKVEFSISNHTNKYHFTIDENGAESDINIEKVFDIAFNFGKATRQGQEIYIGIEFKNKTDKAVDNIISFSVSVNGKTYNIAEGLVLPFYKEENTTTKSDDKKDNDEKITKKEDKTTAKSTTEKTTKFKYIAPEKTNETSKYIAEENTTYSEYENEAASNENSQILTEENRNKETSLSPTSKMLIAFSSLCIITGVIAAIYYSFKFKKSNQNDKSDNDKQ